MQVMRSLGLFLSSYKFTVILAIAILVISLLPGNSIPDSPLLNIRFMDKYIHFSMYTSFFLAALWEMRCSVKCLRKHALLFFLSGLASLCIEIIQGAFIDGRTADWTDLVANLSGLFFGWLLYKLIRQRLVRS